MDDLRALAFGVDADGKAEAAGLFGGVAFCFGEVDVAQGVLQVVREVGVVIDAENLVVAGQEVEDLNRAVEVPFARGRFEDEPVALQDFAELGYWAAGLLGQADAQPLHGAVDPRGVFFAAVLGADFFLLVVQGLTVVRRLRGDFRFLQVRMDAR